MLRDLNGALDRAERCAGGCGTLHSTTTLCKPWRRETDPGLHEHHLQTGFSPVRRRRPRHRRYAHNADYVVVSVLKDLPPRAIDTEAGQSAWSK